MASSFVACRVALIAVLMLGAFAGSAAAEDRALKLFFTHTGERATITFKRGGKYDPRGLAQINRFLRDWRKNEPTRIDPELLDLVWEVYQRSGARETIHVVSAYRSPSTNGMLRNRSRSSGVAKHSQHTLGKAMDFYIPGVKLASLRAIAMQMQIGGVGFYPNSGSPFVHLDVGRVRAWPRMSRQELARLFPNGRTLHVPTDGRPLPGYDVAVAQSRKRPSQVSSRIAAVVDEDDDAGSSAASRSGAPDSSLMTSMLPTPRSRAVNGLEAQLGKRVAEESKEQPFADLAAYAVPLPAWRPTSSIVVIPTAAPERPAPPVVLASLVVGRNDAGKLVVSDNTKNTTDSAMAKMQPMAQLPSSATQDVSAGVGTMSTGAIVAWALQPPGMAVNMTLPSLVGAPIPMHEDMTDIQDGAAYDGDDFDVERFGFEG
ncbi:DUF882 domain-containing protein [Rhizobium sp. P40RR-XXII]|uniref:DUF882 domain-containing protein n=1 Tax=unclassified Rhizobium TaxID=2613769 RepID=UPI00145789BA|nr:MULTISPECIES: DUF882 domain-containing protein [unclassified Rhizobium]NLR84873.1 DUF882 domain-containing protein [Rhizobium sp. P28RR-XV]NLS16220.1 DUF882 domain-containing protein [Rhizobium sp. P40RR-XXII]